MNQLWTFVQIKKQNMYIIMWTAIILKTLWTDDSLQTIYSCWIIMLQHECLKSNI